MRRVLISGVVAGVCIASLLLVEYRFLVLDHSLDSDGMRFSARNALPRSRSGIVDYQRTARAAPLTVNRNLLHITLNSLGAVNH